MLKRKTAGRYAEALFDLASKRDVVKQWEDELEALGNVIGSMPDLKEFLSHPEIPISKKEKLIIDTFREKVCPEILSMLLMLVKRGWEADVNTVLDVYRQIILQRSRTLPVLVKTAVPMSEKQADHLFSILSGKTGMKIEMERQVDPDVIAGMTIRLGDRLIDASARTTLEELGRATKG